jgi:hypothetical protein
VKFYETLDRSEFPAVKTMVGGELDRVKPELGLFAAGADVNVRWLLRFVAVVDEAEAANAKHGRHG